MTTDWANEPAPGTIGGAPAAAGAPMAAAPAAGYTVQDDWTGGSGGAAQQSDWAAESAPPASTGGQAAPAGDQTAQWGGSTNWN